MNNKVVLVLVVLILIIGGFLLFKNSTVAPTGSDLELGVPVPGSDVEETVVVENEEITIKEFVVTGVPFSFTPNSMVVNKGDTVKVTFKNDGGTHDFKIDEFNVATPIINAGEEQSVTFVADKSGTFEYYCSVGNHRALGMVGTFTVR